MSLRRLNWPIWLGFLLTVAGFVSYPLFFVGVRRAFAPGRARKSKVTGAALAALSVVIIGLFIFSTFVMSKWLPASKGAPQVGQQVPDFTLSDTSGRPVSLSTLLASPVAVRARLEDYEREDRSFDGLTLDGVCERNPELNVEVVASGLHILESSPAESIKTDIPQSRRPPDPPVECGLRGKLQPGRWF